MKRITFALLLFSSITNFAQQTITSTIDHDGISRKFITYIPSSYDGNSPVSLVLNFHGYTSNANSQMWYGDFRPIADTAGFIVVHPEGTKDGSNTTHWNVGGWTVGSTVDDVGFVDLLLDTLVLKYNIDLTKIYSTGMSNGGYMSYLLACQLSNRIAAVASVTGSMTNQIYNQCNPSHPTPILEIHGTDDPTVSYYGGSTATGKSVEQVLNYWKNYNNSNTIGDTVLIADIDISDSCTAEHIKFEGGDSAVTVEHFKINKGLHTWPGAAWSGIGTNNDFNASNEIWKFFSKYDLSQFGIIPVMPSPPVIKSIIEVKNVNRLVVSPNPVTNQLVIEGDIKNKNYIISNSFGQTVQKGRLSTESEAIDISAYKTGVYFIKVENEFVRFYKMKKN